MISNNPDSSPILLNELNLDFSLILKEQSIRDIYALVLKKESEFNGETEVQLGDNCDLSHHGDPFCFHFSIDFMLPSDLYKEMVLSDKKLSKNLEDILKNEIKRRDEKIQQGILNSDEYELEINVEIIYPNFDADLFEKSKNYEDLNKRIILIDDILKKANKFIIFPTVVKRKSRTELGIIGGITLPIDYSIKGNFDESLGKPLLDSIGLSFKDSKIGIKRIDLKGFPNYYYIELKLDAIKAFTIEIAVIKAEELASQILDLGIKDE